MVLNKQTFLLRVLLQTVKAQWVTFLKSLQREFSHSILGKLFKEVIYNCSLGKFCENTKVKYEVLSYQKVKNTVVIYKFNDIIMVKMTAILITWMKFHTINGFLSQ